MVEHQGIAPCIPVWKILADGHQRASLNTYARWIRSSRRKEAPYFGAASVDEKFEPPCVGCCEMEMESRVRVALTCEVLRTTAWAARPTGRFKMSGRMAAHPPALFASWRP